MKKIILILLMLILINFVSAKSLIVTPYILNVEYVLGTSQPSSQTIIFSNEDNTSFPMSISKAGDTANFINLSESSFYFNGTETKTLTISFNIPQTTNVGIKSGEIRYGTGNEYIPIYINVKKIETDCRIIISEQYKASISREAPIYYEDFSFKVANACSSGVTITRIREDKTFMLKEGRRQPIRLKGLLPSGDFEPGDVLHFLVEYDVKDLSTAIYDSSIIIEAVDKLNDQSINKIINFQIAVSGGTPLPYNWSTTTISSYPNCNPSQTDLLVNNTYQIICTNVVDPNLKVEIDSDSEYFEGTRVEPKEDLNQLIWYFKAKKEGNAKVYISYKIKTSTGEYDIGPTYAHEFKISSFLIQSGTVMKFEFYNQNGILDGLWQLKGGDKLRVVAKDNKSNEMVTSAILYLNGAKLESNEFDVESGKNYVLAITAPGYSILEQTFTVSNPPITLSFFPGTQIKLGDILEIITNPNASSIFWDGSEIGSTFIPQITGNFVVKAIKEGYTDTNATIIVTKKAVRISEIPEDIKLGKDFIIEYDGPVLWQIDYQKDNKTAIEVYKDDNDIPYRDESNIIKYLPKDKGIYHIKVEGDIIATYDKTGWKFPMWILWGVLAVLVILGFWKFVLPKMKKEGVSVEYGSGEEREEIVERIR